MQYLRALAALTVMVSHILGDIAYHGGPALFGYYYVGAAGVDLFFVISGFVMVYSARPLFGVRGGAALFLRRRLERIVPLYWLATLAYGLVQIGQGKWDVVRPALVLSALVFWPYSDAAGLHLPVYSIGWTLDDECFFYAVFALGLLCGWPWGAGLVGAGLLGVVLLGAAVPLPQPLAFWAQPVLIDFLIGMAAGAAYLRGRRCSARTALVLGSLGLLAYGAGTLAGFNAIPNVPERFPRWIAWGLPCGLLFVALVFRDGPARRPNHLLAYLGDASYAIYLVHVLVIIALRPLLPRLEAVTASLSAGVGLPAGLGLRAAVPLAGWADVALVAAATLLAAAALHSGFERPLARALRRARRPAAPAAARTPSVYTG